MARDRSDTRWSEATTWWERLAWARSTHPKYVDSAADFARDVKEEPATYRAYERPPSGSTPRRGIPTDKAALWARTLDVDLEWLLEGAPNQFPWREKPQRGPTAEEIADLAEQADEEQQTTIRDMVKVLVRKVG